MTQELDNYRRQIDAIDDQLIALLKDRSGVVQKVADFKRDNAPNHFPIRSGREATMVRRIAKAFKKSGFSPAAAAQIWRIIIGSSTAMEAKLVVSVFAPDENRELYWLAREYFGPAATFIKQPHVKRVIGDVIDGKAGVGVVPVLSMDDGSYWWTNLLRSSPEAPRIFAHLPFVYADKNKKQSPAALAFACVPPEASGDDVSFYVLEVEHDVSQHRLQTALVKEDLQANWISIAALSPNLRHHLIELKGFVAPDDKHFKKFLASIGAAMQHVHFLGSHAVPFVAEE